MAGCPDSTRTRFAPSPTGDLHLGGAWAAVASFEMARRSGGNASAHVLRVEDLDRPRVVGGSIERILEDLAWLGITWDEGPDVTPRGPFAPYTQSARGALYLAALEDLTARGHTYPCDCSRAEIARVASAPHAGDEVVYPGTCRDLDPARAFKRQPAIRLRVPDARVEIVDGIMGPFAHDLAKDVGDFVLQRGDGVFAYQLAVTVDDLAMRITDVTRGADLLASTPRQIVLARMLGATVTPRYWHVPLVVATDGARLAKRTRGATVRDLRAAGVSAAEIVHALRVGLGLGDEGGDGSAKWRREPWPIPACWTERFSPA